MNQEYLEFAKKLARDAGEIMLKYFNQRDISHYKGDDTIVMLADTEINQMVIDRVRVTYPDHGVYGEEDSFGHDGEPQVGVVYDPFTENLYTAVKGEGAHKNGEKIHVNSFSYNDKQEISNFDLWPEAEIYSEVSSALSVLQKKSYLVSVGSCIHACMLVAEGSFVSQIFAGTKGKNVDIAAAKVIVEEAGGKVTDIFGNEQRYDRGIKGAIVSNGLVHDEIVRIIKGPI
ncbi:hypothetical protein FACS189431_5420 [Alphaproteobacteria bacterium]|nr:hypothetical protein FACS189431_5420 [Alphaproteobacteria bacterium]